LFIKNIGWFRGQAGPSLRPDPADFEGHDVFRLGIRGQGGPTQEKAV